MSSRGKRPNNGSSSTDCPSPVKKRKGRPPTISSSIDVDELVSTSSNGGGGGGGGVLLGVAGMHQSASSSTAWQARPHLDLKMSSIYNRSAPEAPAELFRYKSLIT